jgi:hypothetical protein
VQPFFSAKLFRVKNPAIEHWSKPPIEVTAPEDLVVALRVARAGYYGGDPERVLKASFPMVMAIIQYEDFCNEYERTFHKINTER